jgi:hypothetical protein
MLLARFPALANAKDDDGIVYAGVDGRERIARVIVALHARPPVAIAPETEYERVAIGEVGALALPPAAVPVAVGPGRHSATSLLAHSRCPKRYWLKYVAGLREPEPFGPRSDVLLPAVTRGQIVHDVIERWDEESSELDLLLEDAIGRWDENAPPPDSHPGRRYRGELRTDVSNVIEHEVWKERVAREGSRRELAFLHLAGPDAITQGAIDLAVPTADGNGLELTDVKTTQCTRAEAEARAQTYRPQSEVYTAAASAIGGLPVLRFGFLYSHPGVNVETELDDDAREQAVQYVIGRIARAGSGEAAMTEDPAECRVCGFRRVRMCAGIE